MTSEQDYQPLTFESVTASEATLGNLLSARSMHFQMPLNHQNFLASVERVASPEKPAYQLMMEFGGHPFRIFMGKSFLDYLLPEKIDHKIIHKLPGDLLRAVIDHSFSTFKDTLQTNAGSTLSLSSFGKAEPPKQPTLEISLTAEDLTTKVYVEINNVILRLLTAIPPQQNHHIPDIPFRLFLQKGRTTLTYHEFKGLESGDLVFLEQQAGDTEVIVSISQTMAYLGSTSHSEVTILQRLEIMEEYETEDGFHEHPDDDAEMSDEQPEDPSEQGVDINDLPVHLTFDVGEQQLSAAEILGLKAGFIFQLENPIQQPLRIRANGKLIGKGELVEVDGRLAARITELTQ